MKAKKGPAQGRARVIYRRQAISRDTTQTPLAVQVISHRHGLSLVVAALITELAGLGPQEARHG